MTDELKFPFNEVAFVRKLNSSTVKLPEKLELQEPLPDLMASMDAKFDAWVQGKQELSAMSLYMN